MQKNISLALLCIARIAAPVGVLEVALVARLDGVQRDAVAGRFPHDLRLAAQPLAKDGRGPRVTQERLADDDAVLGPRGLVNRQIP